MNKSIITLIIDLLKLQDFYGISETIDIAKGKNKIPLNFKEGKNAYRRNKKY